MSLKRNLSILAAGAALLPAGVIGGKLWGEHTADAKASMSEAAIVCLGKVGLNPARGHIAEGCEYIFRDAPAIVTYISGEPGDEIYDLPTQDQVQARANVYAREAKDAPDNDMLIGGLGGLLCWAGVVKMIDLGVRPRWPKGLRVRKSEAPQEA